MEYQIIQINQNSWRVEDSGVRFFLLTGHERALLVDSGRNVHTARDIAGGLTNLPISLLNTHADGDHIGSNAQFESFFMHPDEEPNYRRSDRGGEILPIREGDVIDLTQAFMDELFLQLPMVSLCKPDCKGLCPVCGVDLNRFRCDCAEKTRNSAFDALKALSFEDKEV